VPLLERLVPKLKSASGLVTFVQTGSGDPRFWFLRIDDGYLFMQEGTIERSRPYEVREAL